jgi:hypothetical protein
MSKNISKSRYDFIKGLLSYENPDLDRVTKLFIEWATLNQYLIFRKDNIFTHERTYKAVKGAKRGNDVYAWRVRKALEHLRKLPDHKFFNSKDRNGVHRTKAVFITLTYRRFLRIDEAWERVGEDFNRWITDLRKQYGKIDVLRAWESQRARTPHGHQPPTAAA